VAEAFASEGKPAGITAVCADEDGCRAIEALGIPTTRTQDIAALATDSYDDILYFGAEKQTVELLDDKLAPSGIINVVLAGKKIGAPASIGVGRVHYGMKRWTGTTGASAAEAYAHIPATGEIREGERIAVIGAGGPMGQMHVIRDVCSGVKGISVVGTDFDEARLDSLREKAGRLAATNGVEFRLLNPQKEEAPESFSYYALMAPVPALVADAVKTATENAIINIFAGIPAPTKHEIDLDVYIEKHCFMFGTSGSVIEDMKIVLRKLEGGQLDTNCSIDAVSGMAGAIKGIDAVENRTLAGKIIVYPMLHDLDLIPLPELEKRFPSVAGKLNNGEWTREAEEELLRVATNR
jgi:hypothetical protein